MLAIMTFKFSYKQRTDIKDKTNYFFYRILWSLITINVSYYSMVTQISLLSTYFKTKYKVLVVKI